MIDRKPCLTRWCVLGLALLMSVFVLGCPDDGGSVINNPPPPPPPPQEELNVAFVLTAGAGTGSYSTVDLDTRRVTPDINAGGVHSDAIARFFNGRIYVVNRQGVDSIQIIDPEADFTTPAGAELSVGNGTNPHDIVFINGTKAYVSLYKSPELLIINPTTLSIRGSIPLANLIKPGDGDGAPEQDHMLFHNGLVYLTLQHLDFTADPPAKVDRGEVVIIDPNTDRVVDVLTLNGRNPFSDIVFSPALNRILVSSVGDLVQPDGDGGIDAIHPAARRVEGRFRVTETALGGDITHFAIVSATKGFAVVSDATFRNALVTFNPTTGARLTTIVDFSEPFLPHFAINSRGELYLAVNETTPTPRLRIFDVDQDQAIGSVRSGNLPPWFVLFIEE